MVSDLPPFVARCVHCQALLRSLAMNLSSKPRPHSPMDAQAVRLMLDDAHHVFAHFVAASIYAMSDKSVYQHLGEHLDALMETCTTVEKRALNTHLSNEVDADIIRRYSPGTSIEAQRAIDATVRQARQDHMVMLFGLYVMERHIGRNVHALIASSCRDKTPLERLAALVRHLDAALKPMTKRNFLEWHALYGAPYEFSQENVSERVKKYSSRFGWLDDYKRTYSHGEDFALSSFVLYVFDVAVILRRK